MSTRWMTSRESLRPRGVASVALGLLLVTAGPRSAAGELFATTITQVTTADGVASSLKSSPSVNADGTRVVFESTADLTGGNPDGRVEIFLADISTDPPSITQITRSVGFGSSRPSIDAAGARIAFQSDVPQNGFSVFEIFVADLRTSPPTLTQITSGILGIVVSGSPVISADGTRVAFLSGQPIVHTEILLADLTTSPPTISPVTTMAGGFHSISPSFRADGRRLAFVSNDDLTGENPSFRFQVYVADLTTSPATFSQVTRSIQGDSHGPDMNAGGSRIAFTSNADLTGGNPDGSREVFLADLTTSPPTLIQVTRSLGYDPVDFGSATSINAEGTRIAFTSGADLTGGSPDGIEQVFLADLTGSAVTITQVTASPTSNSVHPALTAEGTRVVFASSADLTGQNPDGRAAVFVADVVNVPQVVSELPESAFQNGAEGIRDAIESLLEEVERLIAAGRNDVALQKLENLRRRADGCGTAADTNDWIVDCAAQIELRGLIDALIVGLGR